MKGSKILKRISACALACASFSLVACDGLPSSSSTGGGSGKLDMDEVTLEAVYAVLESYGVVEDIDEIETLFNEDNAKGYEYLIVEENGVILVGEDEEEIYGKLGDCEHKKFNTAKTQLEADCESMGLETSTCKNCTAVKYTFEMPFGHDWELVEEIPATETKKGKKIYECEECREGKTEYTPKLEDDDSGDDSGGNRVDPSKTVLHVATMEMGDGRFLEGLAAHFEEEYQDTAFEAGKKGVQVEIEYNQALTGNLNTLPYMQSEVLFIPSTVSTEALIMNGFVADLTDIVCEKDRNTGISIEDVMSQADKEEFSFQQKYYAIPYIRDSWGLIYNAGLFEEYNYEVPNTTEEMFVLCEEMKMDGVTPLITAGAYSMYIDELAKIWWAQYEGVDNYTNFWNGVNEENRYTSEIFAQEGRLTSWEILQKIYERGFLHQLSMTSSTSHAVAQARFLTSTFNNDNPIAMITEGSWMMTEAEDIVREIEEVYGFDSLNIRMMKMPVNSAIINKCASIHDDETLSAVISLIDEYSYEEYSNIYDHVYMEYPSVCYEDFELIYEARNLVSTTGYNAIINENVQGHKEAVAKYFLRFVASQEGIETLARTTGTTTALNWAITEDAYASMIPVRQAAFEMIRNGIALPDENNQTMLRFGVNVDFLYVQGRQYRYIFEAIREGHTASEIFASTIDYFANGRFEDMLINYGVADA